jgi:hypothetical protein
MKLPRRNFLHLAAGAAGKPMNKIDFWIQKFATGSHQGTR